MNVTHLTSAVLSLSLLAAGSPASFAPPATEAAPATRSLPLDAADEAHAALPLAFEPNVGQAGPDARFVATGRGHRLALGDGEATFTGPDGSVRMRFGAATAVAAEERLPGVSSYLVGSDPSKWRAGVETFARVRYTGVAPGVDLLFYGTHEAPEYDFVVAPGADPSAVELEFDAPARVDGNGDLVIAAPSGEWRQPRPVVFQETPEGRVRVAGEYRLEGARVRFDVGAYDRTFPLVIDPVMKYATYVGGNGDDRVNRAVVDASGNLYLVGQTLSTNFPTDSPFQTDASGMDGFVTKMNSSGTALIFSTYVGGNGTDNFNDVAIDSSGRIFLAGSSSSGDYPVVNEYDDSLAGDLDAVLTVLNSAGSSIVYSTKIGGGNNDIGNAVAVDVNGNAFLAGETLDFRGIFSRNFPTKSPSSLDPFQDNYGGGRSDAFVCKFDPDESGNTSLVYSTLIGGSAGEGVEAIAVDQFERAYVCGYTESTNFPRQSARQNAYGGGTTDAFVTKFNADGTTVFYSTFHGGGAIDEAFGIALDTSSGTPLPVVVGHTTSSNLPTQLPVQGSKNGPEDAFAFKLNDSGGTFVYSTYFGGPGNDAAQAVAVAADGTAYFTGFSNNSYPLLNPVPINGQVRTTGSTVTRLSGSGQLLFSTCAVGGSGEGVGVDAGGTIYVGGTTSVTSLPATPGAFQQTIGGGPNDGFAFKLDVVDDDTIGVFKPGTRQFQLRDSNTNGPADATATFGVSGDKPVVGDWDGDGRETIGAYTPSTGTFSLRNSNTSGPADLTFVFGGPNLVPIAGDWDGDGDDTIGVYDTATGAYFLNNDNAGGNADIAFQFGLGGANTIPLAGDWNGDGVDTIGFFVTTTREFFLKNTNAPGNADAQFVFGGNGAVPVAGDWNGDGVDTVGIFTRITLFLPGMRFLLRNTNSAGAADLSVGFGVVGDVPLAGNWDGE